MIRTLACALALATAAPAAAQENFPDFDTALLEGSLSWRNLGPWRGGRATTVTGVRQEPLRFYLGAAGGGIWRTDDGGQTWRNVSDGDLGVGTIGALAVAPSDPNVVYAGTGEAQVRGVTTSHGDGVYRSDDGGESWRHLGLELTRHVAAIAVHPDDPDRLWVAAQGNLWRANDERGVYRSTDGGATWERTLFVDEDTGCSSLALGPTNPRVLYAGTWQHRRYPWKVESGGPGSGVWRSTDSGATWTRLAGGLPDSMGKIGVAVSATRPERVWAIVEADEGGLYRSDDRGETWRRVNGERVLRARAWYYTRVVADPTDADTVYVLNAPVLRSIDGGTTFTPVATPHGDNHALWIHPDDGERMINGNDGGANVSFNGGRSWTTQANQPTAQFYRVLTDNQFPYRVYGGQQDNSTVSVSSRSAEDWYPIGGGESAFVAFDPDDPRFVYAGSYQGILTEWDATTRRSRNVMADPFLGLGANPEDLPYRFNWNAPLVVSPFDGEVLYHGANVLLRSDDRGRSWSAISPDLTRDEAEKQGAGGGPLTNEAAGAETYGTLAGVEPCPHDPDTIWVGSDDGLVHVTRDGGATWRDVTPPGIGEALVNAIDASPHAAGTAYVAITRYKFGDLTPHVLVTNDWGATWERRVDGLPAEPSDGAYVRVVREDPERRGLLYAGTEAGVFASLDDGRRWFSLQLDLPNVPVTDLEIRADGDLVAATQGRAFWILDDVSPLRQLEPEHLDAGLVLFAPRETVHAGGGGIGVDYWVGADFEGPVALEVRDADGALVRRYSTEEGEADRLTLEPGLRRAVWNLRTEGIADVPGQFLFGSRAGYRVAPGNYTVTLSTDGGAATADARVAPDPREDLDPAGWRAQQALAARVHAAADGLHRDVVRARNVRAELERLAGREEFALAERARELIERLTEWEGTVLQARQETFQDVINFPNLLNAELLDILGKIDGNGPALTAGLVQRAELLLARAAERATAIEEVLAGVADFNRAFLDAELPAVLVPARGDDR